MAGYARFPAIGGPISHESLPTLDTDRAAKATCDPVAPAPHSEAALAKAARHTLADGTPAPGFSTLMAELATRVRNMCRTPSALPRRALDLIQKIRP